MKRIQIFGDSILRGVLREESGKLKLRADPQYSYISDLGYEVKNNARVGATIKKGLALLRRKRPQPEDREIVLFGFGGNDCDFDWSAMREDPRADYRPNVELSEFTALYKTAIREAQDAGATVAVCNLVPLDSEKYFRWICTQGSEAVISEWLGDPSMLYRWHENYNRAVESVAEATGCKLVNIREAFLTRHDYKDLIGIDGVHPTEAGYKVIDEVFASYLTTSKSPRSGNKNVPSP